jgi:hypothetical protein
MPAAAVPEGGRGNGEASGGGDTVRRGSAVFGADNTQEVISLANNTPEINAKFEEYERERSEHEEVIECVGAKKGTSCNRNMLGRAQNSALPPQPRTHTQLTLFLRARFARRYSQGTADEEEDDVTNADQDKRKERLEYIFKDMLEKDKPELSSGQSLLTMMGTDMEIGTSEGTSVLEAKFIAARWRQHVTWVKGVSLFFGMIFLATAAKRMMGTNERRSATSTDSNASEVSGAARVQSDANKDGAPTTCASARKY